MEFRQYLKILKANIAIIIVFMIAGFAISVFASTKVSNPFKQTQLIFLHTIETGNQETQGYSGYYAGEKARNFTDTAVSILNSSDFQSEAHIQNVVADAKKLSPQLIRLTLSASNPQDQSSTIDRVIETFNSKVKNITGQSFIEAKPLTNPSISSFAGPDKKIMATVGLLAGFIFALCSISVKIYFKL